MGDNIEEQNSKSANLLVSLLIRYPELATVKFEPEARALRFTFLLRGNLNSHENQDSLARIASYLKTYAALTRQEPLVSQVSTHRLGGMTVLEFQRDLATLNQEELSLIITIVRQEFGPTLSSEENPSLGEEELLLQEEFIEEILEDIKISQPDKYLIAFREEGRVLVFNK
ncbi:MAG: hypothetical protein M1299_03505 [Firmicutes bacterium]|nr:hypothetical protein [Bacillota bacterium]